MAEDQSLKRCHDYRSQDGRCSHLILLYSGGFRGDQDENEVFEARENLKHLQRCEWRQRALCECRLSVRRTTHCQILKIFWSSDADGAYSHPCQNAVWQVIPLSVQSLYCSQRIGNHSQKKHTTVVMVIEPQEQCFSTLVIKAHCPACPASAYIVSLMTIKRLLLNFNYLKVVLK